MSSLPSKPLPPWTRALSVRRISSSIPFRVNKGVNGSPMPPRCIKHKKNARAHRRTSHSSAVARTTKLHSQAHDLRQELKKVMRGFGRSCRGQGHVFVKLVRHTEQQLLDTGGADHKPLPTRPKSALNRRPLREAQRERLTHALTTAMRAHEHIRTQSKRLTQGKKLRHYKLVNAYDPTIAPIIKGKSNCPAQFGRKPGIISEPATGFIFANLMPQGNPSDPSYVLPLLDKVQSAIERVRIGPKRHIHSVAGDLGINDPCLRQALHARGILTVGIPKTIEPIAPNPSAQDVATILHEAGLHRKRTPHQVHLACASGYSRPVVESHIASLLARGAGQVRYKGLEGAVLQQGMTVMAHNGAVWSESVSSSCRNGHKSSADYWD